MVGACVKVKIQTQQALAGGCTKKPLAAKLGWKYYDSGDLDTAIKRFNQAWMVDRENPEVYWGFGLIMGQRASQEESEKYLKESIRFLQMATDKAPKIGRIIGDLALSNTILESTHAFFKGTG